MLVFRAGRSVKRFCKIADYKKLKYVIGKQASKTS